MREVVHDSRTWRQFKECLHRKKMARFIFIAVILLHLTPPSLERRVPYGPTVDPGVFVITQVRTCRGGQGYCILGHSCEIDKDFLPDDLGGHCQGLEKAFYPSANFVCCRENPANAVRRTNRYFRQSLNQSNLWFCHEIELNWPHPAITKCT